MQNKEMVKSELAINRQWKDSLKALYSFGVLSITEDENQPSINYLFKKNPELGLKLELFVTSNKLNLTGEAFANFTKNQTTILIAQTLMVRLEELGLIKITKYKKYSSDEQSIFIDKSVLEYSLNEKGLDTVLKLIEHDDNKERFEIQTRISTHLKRNSNISVGVSVLAFCVAVYGATLSFKRLTILEDSLIDKLKTEQIQVVEKTPAQSKKVNTDANQQILLQELDIKRN